MSRHSDIECFLIVIVVGVVFTWIISQYIKKEEHKKKTLNRQSKILITGACKGIGRELALLFARRHNCHIVVFDSEKQQADGLLADITKFGGKGYFYQCDFKDSNTVMKALAQTIAELNTIDLFINTGGLALEKPFEEYCHEELAAIIEINLLSPTILIKELMTIMKAQKSGHLVDVPSMTEEFRSPDIFTYCGVKAAIIKMLQAFQNELKVTHPNIFITVVRPTIIVAKPTQNHVSRYDIVEYARKIYDGIMNQASEVS
jgi:3-oxoacyl-[acyl-carrier protein] reductase